MIVDVLSFHMLYIFLIISEFTQQHSVWFRIVLKFYSVDYLPIDILKDTFDDFDYIGYVSFHQVDFLFCLKTQWF